MDANEIAKAKAEIKKRFEFNVNYLRRNVPPDDIYEFAEQTRMAAMYFLIKWQEHADLRREVLDNESSRKWIANILGLDRCMANNQDLSLDLGLESVDE